MGVRFQVDRGLGCWKRVPGLADHHLRAEHGQHLQQLIHAHSPRVSFDVGNARLHDTQTPGELGLRHMARLAQRLQQLLQLAG